MERPHPAGTPVLPQLRSRTFAVLVAVLLAANVVTAASAGFGHAAGRIGPWGLAALDLVLILPLAVCLVRARVGGPRRAAALWLSAAVAAFGIGNLLLIAADGDDRGVVPVIAQLAYLAFYPCTGAAVLSLLRHDRGTRLRALWLEAAIGAAGAATALAAALSPVLSAARGDVETAALSAAFSVADLALVAMVGGVLTVRGRHGGGVWLWLGVGLAMFCAADVLYAFETTAGTYQAGTLWSVLWSLGLSVAALGLWRSEPAERAPDQRADATLAVPTVAMAIAVVVLFAAARTPDPMPLVVVVLASGTLVLAAIRTATVFRRVRQLSDAQRLSLTDELTGLGNRRALFEAGRRRIAATDPGGRAALLLIDLDDFKAVNDSLGHHAGDELLREMARRLAASVRSADLLVRLGGDEFALVVDLAHGEDGRVRAEQVLDRITRPVVLEGARLRVGASAGIAEAADGCDVPELLRRADVAMYAAKAGPARVEAHDPRLDEDNRRRLELIRELDVAITAGQFLLHYQPKVDVATGRVVGAEALVRWQHPTRGLVYPDAFLPLVEQAGLMEALTRLVLDSAVGQVATWRAAGLDLPVAVNLSASDLLDARLTDRIVTLLARHGVPGAGLELEITETVLVADPDRAREVLTRLRRHGLRVAVDDYGTGYSSLAYLRDLPVDELKLDRSFIASMTEDRRSAAIVRSTIDLAHALGMQVVAEGVEHAATLAALAELRCDAAQGYHFSRPVPASAFSAWLAQVEQPPAVRTS